LSSSADPPPRAQRRGIHVGEPYALFGEPSIDTLPRALFGVPTGVAGGLPCTALGVPAGVAGATG